MLVMHNLVSLCIVKALIQKLLMTRLLVFCFLVVIAFSLSSCNTTQVYSDYNRSVDFRQYRSFAWIPRSDTVHNTFYDNQITEKNIKYYANAEMLDKGYKIDTLEPDLLLKYHFTSQKKTYNVNSYSPSYGYGSNPYNNPYGYNNQYYGYGNNNGYNNNGYNNSGYNNNGYNRGYGQQQVEYMEGSMLIDVIDRRTNELIWRGWTIGTINDEYQVQTEIPTNVHRILSKYPKSAGYSPNSTPNPGRSQPVRTPAPSTQADDNSAPIQRYSSPVQKKNKTKKSSSGSSDEI